MSDRYLDMLLAEIDRQLHLIEAAASIEAN